MDLERQQREHDEDELIQAFLATRHGSLRMLFEKQPRSNLLAAARKADVNVPPAAPPAPPAPPPPAPPPPAPSEEAAPKRKRRAARPMPRDRPLPTLQHMSPDERSASEAAFDRFSRKRRAEMSTSDRNKFAATAANFAAASKRLEKHGGGSLKGAWMQKIAVSVPYALDQTPLELVEAHALESGRPFAEEAPPSQEQAEVFESQIPGLRVL